MSLYRAYIAYTGILDGQTNIEHEHKCASQTYLLSVVVMSLVSPQIMTSWLAGQRKDHQTLRASGTRGGPETQKPD